MTNAIHPEPYAACPCGSGKKYKFCCLSRDRDAARAAAPLFPWTSDANPDGPRRVVYVDMVEGERLYNEGLCALKRGNCTAATTCFRAAIAAAPLIPAAHNNLALALFMQGEVAEAIRVQAAALADLPGPNVFGMSNLARLYITVDWNDDAQCVLDKAMREPAPDVSAAVKVCEALALARRHRDILDCVAGGPERSDSGLSWFAGTAAANLGDVPAALSHLTAALPSAPFGARARERIRLLERGAGPGTVEGDWPYFLWHEMVPFPGIEAFARSRASVAGGTPQLQRSGFFVEVIVARLNERLGTDTDLVELLGGTEHPRADDVLVKLATGTFGRDELRLAAVEQLTARDVWTAGKPYKVWLKGRQQDVVPEHIAVSDEWPSSARDLDDALCPLYDDMVLAAQQEDWPAAERLGRELVAKAPEFPPALCNLGVALIKQGRLNEAEGYLRRAMELEPEYVFAPCALAMLHLEAGRTADARQTLDEVLVPNPVHPHAAATYFTAQTELAFAECRTEASLCWFDAAVEVAPDAPVVRRLKKRLSFGARVAWWLSSRRVIRIVLAGVLRQRCVPRDARIEECYGAYSKSQLAGMLRALRRPVRAMDRKAQFLDSICTWLRRDGSLAAVVRDLTEPEKIALHDVVALGGAMEYGTFKRRHGTDADDGIDWGVCQPKSFLGRLKCRGLLVEATVARVELVFVPAELQIAPAWLAASSE